MGEKSLHSALKYYYEPDEARHEQPFAGFVADILNCEGVTEIQTRNLFSMKRKLAAYAGKTQVTLVHPVVRKRRLIYMDPETGELSAPRLSPKRGRPEDAYSELVHVKGELCGVNVLVPVVDAEEYRIRTGDGKRYGPKAVKYELVPTELCEEYRLSSKEEHLAMLPEGLRSRGFTVKELAGELRLGYRTASAMCAVMLALGFLSREREGRSYVYTVTEGD